MSNQSVANAILIAINMILLVLMARQHSRSHKLIRFLEKKHDNLNDLFRSTKKYIEHVNEEGEEDE